ncbi:aspartate kinase [Ferrimonas balearica DSM 9799]|uniref:Aspartokinase n=1 Tax=Ferrimonas balearica (strain DSM 9799 / CCM 4581 / KCTC 23876 / PAT) TaxID=550540 RepID=E1ST11_FERBD|nr:aspartate kinase [Ferrimonas balearica]ADN75067.1 aspartate kinase [Ferrimonas balearica DSM 9799]
MALFVQKFGGTSVGSFERIEAVADRIARSARAGHQLVVVLSAMAGETNRLLSLAKQVAATPCPRELDMLVSTGEQISIALMAMALHKRGLKAQSLLGEQVGIVTDGRHGRARIREVQTERMQAMLAYGIIPIVAGFQGRCLDNQVTTLGRGGSDTTAVAIAAALKADECQIFTDVDGVYTTDPRVEPKARKMDNITFEEMLELSSLGAKVLQIRSVEYAGRYNVPLRVLSSFRDGEGTLITYEENAMNAPVVSGIAFSRDEASLTLVGVPDAANVAATILAPIGDAGIDVDMIVQNATGDGKADFTFTVARNDLDQAQALLAPVLPQLGVAALRSDDTLCKVSVVGVGMKNHSGVASQMFQTLGQEGISIALIATSEIKISVAIDEKYLELAVRSLHQSFNLAGEE